MTIKELLEEFVEVTYKAGLLHGQGRMGSNEHRQASERSKVLLRILLQKLVEIKNNAP